jgi:hypothetical protein
VVEKRNEVGRDMGRVPAAAWLAWWVLSNRDPRPLFFLFLTVFTTCNLLEHPNPVFLADFSPQSLLFCALRPRILQYRHWHARRAPPLIRPWPAIFGCTGHQNIQNPLSLAAAAGGLRCAISAPAAINMTDVVFSPSLRSTAKLVRSSVSPSAQLSRF